MPCLKLKKSLQAKLDSFKSAEENQFVENNVKPKKTRRCSIWEQLMGQCKKLVTWNDLMRKNTKESKLFAFICKNIKVSGKFHEVP